MQFAIIMTIITMCYAQCWILEINSDQQRNPTCLQGPHIFAGSCTLGLRQWKEVEVQGLGEGHLGWTERQGRVPWGSGPEMSPRGQAGVGWARSWGRGAASEA